MTINPEQDSFETDEDSDSSICSDSSVFTGLAPIFEQTYEEDYLDVIKEKQKLKLDTKPFYTNYEKSCEALERGIAATKFNFSNDQQKSVTISLTRNRSALKYFCPDGKYLRRSRTISLNYFHSLVYGGTTMSFQRHKRRLMKLIKPQKVKGIES